MIDVMIFNRDAVREMKSPGRWFDKHARAWVGVCVLVKTCLLQQIEFLCAADGRPTVVHPELAVNVLGVGTYGGKGHH